MFRGAWEGKTYEQISSESLDFPNVKYLSNDIGPNLWQMLSERFKEKITKTNFRAVIESYFEQSIVPISRDSNISPNTASTSTKTKIDWGEAPNISMISFFEERHEQMKNLKDCILTRQLVTLTGLNGIGKTTVAVKLVEQFEDNQQFEAIIWRSLNYYPPPDLETLLENFLKFLAPNSSKQGENNSNTNLTQNISLLIDYLRKKRCLLVLDHVECLMKKEQDAYAGQYRDNYQQYGEFLERLGKERHGSCLLLITQEKPAIVTQLEEGGFSVSSYLLRGLKEDLKKIFTDNRLSNPERWDELIEIFKGHPFALQNVANKIKHLFGGQVGEYLKERTITRRDVKEMLAQEMNFLSDLEKKIVIFLSTLKGEEQVSFSELKQQLIKLEAQSSTISGAELQDALESLLQRSLILGEKKYRLDPIVEKYIKNKLLSIPKFQNSLDNPSQEQQLEKLDYKEIIPYLEEIFEKS